VSRDDPRSIVVLAPTSTSSSRMTRPSWGTERNPSLVEANLVLIGEKDDWTPAPNCQAVTGKTNFEVVVYPGATHVFNMPSEKPIDYLGHHFVYDEKATQDAQKRADAFMAAQAK
jgi:dienelactone hydrolase